jgi:hypothetical protein
MTLTASERDSVGFRRARFCAMAMFAFKIFAYCACVEITAVGSFLFMKEWGCLRKLDGGSKAGITMAQTTIALWLLMSVVCCLLYLVKILTLQIFEGAVRMGERNNELVFIDRVQRQELRNLTLSEINAIQKSKLTSYDQLSWLSKKPLKPSQESSIEMTTIVHSKSVSVEEDITVSDGLELKQDEEDSSFDFCAICLEEFKIGAWYKKLPKCQHSFHAICIDQWLSKRAACPACREEVFIEEKGLEIPSTQCNNNLELSPPVEMHVQSDRSNLDLHI